MEFKPCPFCGNVTVNIVSFYHCNENTGFIDLNAWAECPSCQARSKKVFLNSFIGDVSLKSEKEKLENLKNLYDIWNRRVNE